MGEAYLHGQSGGRGVKRAAGIMPQVSNSYLEVTGLGFKPTQVRVYYYSPDYSYASINNGSLVWAIYDNGVMKNCYGSGTDVKFDNFSNSNGMVIKVLDDGFGVANYSKYPNMSPPNYFYYEAWEE